MLDRYQKNRERMQNKPKDEPEPAVEENESSEETQASSENKTEAETATETDVIERALQKRRNRRPLWQRFLIKMVLVIVQVIAIACFFEFANYVMAHYG